MNAGATEISGGAIGLVYLANIAPSMITKLTLPYWVPNPAASPRAPATPAHTLLQLL